MTRFDRGLADGRHGGAFVSGTIEGVSPDIHGIRSTGTKRYRCVEINVIRDLNPVERIGRSITMNGRIYRSTVDAHKRPLALLGASSAQGSAEPDKATRLVKVSVIHRNVFGVRSTLVDQCVAAITKVSSIK